MQQQSASYNRDPKRPNPEGYHVSKSSQFKPDEILILDKLGITVQDLNDPKKLKTVKTKGIITADEEAVFKRMSRREKCRQSAINYRNSQRRKKRENESRIYDVTIENLKSREKIKELIFRLKAQKTKLNLDLIECQVQKDRYLGDNERCLRDAEFWMIEGQGRIRNSHLNHLPNLNTSIILDSLNYESHCEGNH